MKQKIYIAGKVTGLPIADCTIKFGTAQKQIEALGHEAVNPLAVVNDWQCPWDLAMRKCITALMNCQSVLALDNHDSSPGARIELQLALHLGIPVYYDIKHIKEPQKVY
ncbi:DUF4406 domain-containing protein [Flavobacterium sp. UMI-01]|uniref:DUF4406 domain-containing protein n=1 Tax=Flavobacterium sp. UMI-01 TaxID=1441053 RepID=UPI001C7CFA6E|nr:DUF4406 domain-containing protein [Flavobacterium sp. UMI-01]GIZ10262.1 hypothetical protein FUMI01_29860 [Flavobacterium sp. UMI-01]